MSRIVTTVRLGLFLPFLCLLLNARANAQEGKPIYTISITQNDESLGDIEVELFPDIAPLHTANFDSLVTIGFYNGTAIHRVVPGFVIQGGDPNSRDQPRDTWGFGQQGQRKIPAEFSDLSHVRGIVSAARVGNDINSATSQFFICVGSPTNLDGNYSIYGRVRQGMDLVDQIVAMPRDARDNPVDKVEMMIARTGMDETIPGVPMQTVPSSGENFSAAPQLIWQTADDAIAYVVQVSDDPDFTSILQEKLTAKRSFQPQMLTPGKYYWRVQATTGGQRGEFSDVRDFTISAASGVHAVPVSPDVETFNVHIDASGNVSARFRNDREAHVRLWIVDAAGRRVDSPLSETLPAGNHLLQFETGNLPAGLYFCRLQSDGNVMTRKLVVVR